MESSLRASGHHTPHGALPCPLLCPTGYWRAHSPSQHAVAIWGLAMEGIDTQGAVEDGLARLARKIDRLNEVERRTETVSGLIGDDAWPSLVHIIRELEQAGPEDLEPGGAAPDQYDPELRQAARMLACVVGLATDLEDKHVPLILWHMIDNVRLPLDTIAGLCEGRHDGFRHETPVATLRQAARMLIAGQSHERICDHLGISRVTVRKVDNMLSAKRAHHNREVRQARRALDEGLSIRETASRYGWSTKKARNRRAEAQQASQDAGHCDDEDGDGCG